MAVDKRMRELVFITGPSGAGKSTTAGFVAANWPGRCACIDFDRVRTLIKAGYAEPAHGWSDEAEQQWEIAKKVVAVMTETYLAQNVSVVVEAFATFHDYPTWQEVFGQNEPYTFVLLPDLDSVIKRNSQRTGAALLKEIDVRQNHEWSERWRTVAGVTILDNSTEEPEQTAKRILQRIQAES
jgi:adenylylsulfate kinase-like enzyme